MYIHTCLYLFYVLTGEGELSFLNRINKEGPCNQPVKVAEMNKMEGDVIFMKVYLECF